ncbi:MAG: hypothetical protein WA989_16540, partial [Henriciella sp.]|uniref:hypothetical protein n=1 Tax=Henriciella sp. TaxID=1968823 RepID=UPI003C7554C6
RLVPAIDRAGSGSASTVQLNGIPIPLRVSGNWASPNFAPDFSGVRAALQRELRDRAVDRVTEGLDDELGAIVSGALGRSQPSSESGQVAEPLPEEENASEEAEAEGASEEEGDPSEKLVRDALGSIFGPN